MRVWARYGTECGPKWNWCEVSETPPWANTWDLIIKSCLVSLRLALCSDSRLFVHELDVWTLFSIRSQGHEKVVKILIENQAEVNAMGKDRETPLHIAVGNGNSSNSQIYRSKPWNSVVRFLGLKNRWISFFLGFEGIVKMLIENGANVDMKFREGLSSLHLTAENGTPKNWIHFPHCNLTKIFIHPIVQGHERIAKVLIESKADVDSQRDDGETPLLMAARNGKSFSKQFWYCGMKNDVLYL